MIGRTRFEHRKALLILLLLPLCSMTGWAGQEPRQDKDDTIRLRSDLVSLNASVVDSRGHAIGELDVRDFEVYEDGVKQTIANFSAMREPFTLMLLLDVSGSTAQETDLIKDAARSFLEHIGPDDRIGVVVFSNEVVEVAELTDTRERAMQEIEGIATAEGRSG